MIKHVEMFASWDRETQAQCVALYHIALGMPMKVSEKAPDVKHSRRKVATRRTYRPRPQWSDEDRLALFEEFDKGNINYVQLARRFGRTELAIRAQYDKSYAQFKGA